MVADSTASKGLQEKAIPQNQGDGKKFWLNVSPYLGFTFFFFFFSLFVPCSLFAIMISFPKTNRVGL